LASTAFDWLAAYSAERNCADAGSALRFRAGARLQVQDVDPAGKAACSTAGGRVQGKRCRLRGRRDLTFSAWHAADRVEPGSRIGDIGPAWATVPFRPISTKST